MMKTLVTLLVLLAVSVKGKCVYVTSEVNDLRTQVSELVSQQADLEERLSTLENKLSQQAAFRATLNTDTITADTPIPMTPVEQLGDNYNEDNGIYTIPYPGWYTINVQLFPREAFVYTLDLMLNTDILARARCRDHSDNDGEQGVTCNTGITVRLNTGDQLSMQSSYTNPYWYAPFDSIFSIILVTPVE